MPRKGCPIPPAIEARIQDPLLLTSIQTMTVAILGAVLVMTVKPGLRDSIIIAAVSLFLGVASAQPALRSRKPEQVSEAVPVGTGK